MPERIPGPAYRIHTPRLVIRCYEPADAPLLQSAIAESLEHLLPWMPWAHDEPEPLQAKVERLRRFRGMFDLGQDFVYAILDRDEARLLGGTGLAQGAISLRYDGVESGIDGCNALQVSPHHLERRELPMVDEACRCDGVQETDVFMHEVYQITRLRWLAARAGSDATR